MKALLVAVLLALTSAAALAQGGDTQAAALVDGVQMPAWRERDGKRTPLVPGMELRAGDRIISGKDARVLVKLSEGSVVKLGENGALRLAEMRPTRELFRAALQVLEGAFRFTSDLAAKARKREVTVRVEQVTIGIRGTDFWGRGRGERQIVCLIEGAIQVGAPGEPPLTLDRPRQFYQRDKGRAQPVGFVEASQLEQWSREVEIEPGRGALRSGGRFGVQLAAGDTREALAQVQEQLADAGYAAEIAPSADARQAPYVVRIRHLPSREEAQALARRLDGQFGIADPVVLQ
ncbi:MAG TPA: FecR domain-containing protein [Burkholderiales bacterium]|nr:FecR domain-containing protein [Burkholderiales bacterium]